MRRRGGIFIRPAPPRRLAEGVDVASAGAERDSRASQVALNLPLRAGARHRRPAARSVPISSSVATVSLIVERGVVVVVERQRVSKPHPEREIMTLSENASRHGYRFA